MTSTLTETTPQPLGGMPAWAIVADLTPPELVTRRRVAVLREVIGTGLIVLVALCLVGYGIAVVRHNGAADEAAAADTDTTGLQRSAADYAAVTRAEVAIDQLDGRITSLMAKDADVPGTLAAIRSALPASMSIAQVSLSIDTGEATDTAPSLDATGGTTIGTVTVSGSARTLDDLPAFVDRLGRVKGLVNVIPTSNQVEGRVATFSVTGSLTDQLYTHRYDATRDDK